MSHAGRQVIFPAPRYHDAWAAITFLERSFGFERQQVHEGKDGSVAHGELLLGAATVGLSSAGGSVRPENPWTSVRSGVYVALPDAATVDAHHARALAAGATIAMPLEDTDYGSRQYSVWDHERHLWCFGTYTHAPVDESRLFLVLRYADRALARDWLREAFGFESAGTGRDGSAEHLELRLGDGRLWLSRAAAGDARWGDSWHATHVVVPDVDAHYERARQSGATIVAPPADLDGFGRVYVARDVEDYLWTFGSDVPDAATSSGLGGRRS
jgi:uncharacterized glyoxalase superfamily protein PhnB